MMMMMMLLYLSDLFDGLKGIKEGGEEVWKDRQEVDDVHEAFYELPPEPMMKMKMFYMIKLTILMAMRMMMMKMSSKIGQNKMEWCS